MKGKWKKTLVAQHAGDVSSKLVQEIMHLKAIHTSNLGEKPLNPIQLLNAPAVTSLMVISQLLRSSSHLLHVAGYSS